MIIKKIFLTLILLFSIANNIKSEETPLVTLPDKLSCKVGRMLKITATTACKELKWKVLSSEADIYPIPGTKDCLFVAPLNSDGSSANYIVFCWGAVDNTPSDLAKCIVTVEGKPIPDSFKESLQKAYNLNTSPNKAANKLLLANMYNVYIKNIVNDTKLTTASQVLLVAHNSTQTLLNDELKDLRRIIADELDTKLPTDPGFILDDKTRVLIGNQFSRVSNLLSSLE